MSIEEMASVKFKPNFERALYLETFNKKKCLKRILFQCCKLLMLRTGLATGRWHRLPCVQQLTNLRHFQVSAALPEVSNPRNHLKIVYRFSLFMHIFHRTKYPCMHIMLHNFPTLITCSTHFTLTLMTLKNLPNSVLTPISLPNSLKQVELVFKHPSKVVSSL